MQVLTLSEFLQFHIIIFSSLECYIRGVYDTAFISGSGTFAPRANVAHLLRQKKWMYVFTSFAVEVRQLIRLAKFLFCCVVNSLGSWQLEKRLCVEVPPHTFKEFVSVLKGNWLHLSPNPGPRANRGSVTYFLVIYQSGVSCVLFRSWHETFTPNSLNISCRLEPWRSSRNANVFPFRFI